MTNCCGFLTRCRRPFPCIRSLKEKSSPGWRMCASKFGLAYKKESPRIDIATEPYPNRWTHHVLVSEEEQIDEELLGWVEEAAAFSAAK